MQSLFVALGCLLAVPALASETGDHPSEPTEHPPEGGSYEEGGHEATHEEGKKEGHEAHEAGHDEHGEHKSPRFLFGVKGAGYGTFVHGESSLSPALGVFVAFVAVPNHLEIELDSKVIFGAEHTSFPLALILKKTFHASKEFHPFVGLGPLVSFVPSEHGLHVFPGGELVGGTYYWFGKHMGLTLEASYGILMEEEHLAHEVGAVAGLAWAY